MTAGFDVGFAVADGVAVVVTTGVGVGNAVSQCVPENPVGHRQL